MFLREGLVDREPTFTTGPATQTGAEAKPYCKECKILSLYGVMRNYSGINLVSLLGRERGGGMDTAPIR